MVIYLFDLAGTAVFAVSGSLAAGKRRMDLFGVAVLAVVTALGGGTIRDVILGAHPVFWVTDPVYIIVAVAASLFTFSIARTHALPSNILAIADAVGLAVFTVIGTQKALAFHVPGLVAVIMGIMTGVAGGIIRDLLSGQIPLVLSKEIYATASLCGGAAYVLLSLASGNKALIALLSIAVTLGLRLAAIRWKLSLPHLFLYGDEDSWL